MDGYALGYISSAAIIAFLYALSVLSPKGIPMRISKVSLCVRQHGTRKYTKVRNSRSNLDCPAGTIYVLRYGSTWEPLDSTSLADARVKVLRRQN